MEGFMPDDEKVTEKVTDDGDQDSVNKPGDDETTGLFNSERDALYADYYGEEDDGKSDDPDQTPSSDKPEDDDHDTDSDDNDKVDAGDDTPDDKGDDPSSEEDKDQKMVPLAALHEERKKRQDLTGEVKVLSDRVTQLLEDNTKLLDRIAPKDTDADYESPDDDELDAHDRQVQKELKELKEFKKGQEDERELKRNEEIRAQFEKAVVEVSKELSKEGLHGFDAFGIHMVAQKLREKMVELGKDEAIKEYDHPEGWKKLYKEEIWPDFSKKFSVGLVETEVDRGKKIENKKKAKLPNRPKGPAPAEEGKKDEDLTQEEMFADYMKRRKTQLFD
jgi:hypothetical protein